MATPQPTSPPDRPGEWSALAAGRRALAGFFLLGVLMSSPGALLPAWAYHVNFNPRAVGAHFLSVGLGLVAAPQITRRFLHGRPAGLALVLACSIACAAIASMAFTIDPAPLPARLVGLFALGIASGILNAAVFRSIMPVYRQGPAATVNLAGAFFGLGCLATALLLAGTFNVYTVPSTLVFLALLPGFFAGVFARGGPAAVLAESPVAADKLHISGWLLGLLLLFQFANEWILAGWLPLFLIQRLGTSPLSALMLLALYWSAILGGRLVIQTLLPRVNHVRILGWSAGAALFGCVLLSATNNLSGATVGVLLTGGGFAAVYPLAVERIGERFQGYHPGLFNGIFSVAVAGGLLGPWLVSYPARWWGVGSVMLVPLVGTCLVSMLVLLIWLEARFERTE
ncbi:MAG: hypothetical protein FJW40_22430 [Acidobacteria bacterium]|nr:hypothetical protein [Acidobacteriota bacterium]